MAKRIRSAADFIMPLDMNGLSGRMLYLPPPRRNNKQILFVYGQHSRLERWWGLLQFANHYGAVTAPDLPGFGGMESFYKIGKRPSLDNYADYLAAFIKLRYRRTKVSIIGMSLGFVIATRMLQRYPELLDKVDMLVSLVGMASADDLSLARPRYWFYRTIAALFLHRLPAFFFRYTLLNSHVLRATYANTFQARAKFAAAKDKEEFDRFMDEEVDLWHMNDVRTHAYTLRELLTLNNTGTRVDKPIWHVDTKGDQYLNHTRVVTHLEQIFPKVDIAQSKLGHHAPSVIADEKAAAPLIPPALRRAFRGKA